MNPDAELEQLVGTLLQVAERCDHCRVGGDAELRYALGFCLKVAHHAASTLTLLRGGSTLGPEYEPFIDRTSVCVLARAGWECYLLFHHVFVAPGSADERELRFLRWLTESLRRRQGYDTPLEGQQEQLAEEKGEIDRIEARIKANPAFQNVAEKERKAFLDPSGRWRPGWAKIAANAGIANQYAGDAYNYLCDHAHSGWFSVEGLRGGLSGDDLECLQTSVYGLLSVAVAGMLVGLSTLFPGCLDGLQAEERGAIDAAVAAGQTTATA